MSLELTGNITLKDGVNLTHGTPPTPTIPEGSGDNWNSWPGTAVSYIMPLPTESSIEIGTPNDVWMSWDTTTSVHLTPLPTTSGIDIPTVMDVWMSWTGT